MIKFILILLGVLVLVSGCSYQAKSDYVQQEYKYKQNTNITFSETKTKPNYDFIEKELITKINI